MTQNPQIEAKALADAVRAFNTFGHNMSDTPPIEAAIRAYLASQEAAAPSEEPAGEQWRAIEYGEPVTSWKDLERGDRIGWQAIADRSPDKYAVERRFVFASPAVAPVASVKGLIERLRDVAGPVRLNNGCFADLAFEAAEALSSIIPATKP